MFFRHFSAKFFMKIKIFQIVFGTYTFSFSKQKRMNIQDVEHSVSDTSITCIYCAYNNGISGRKFDKNFSFRRFFAVFSIDIANFITYNYLE